MGIIDETGNKFGKLTVIKRSRKKTRKAFWDCLCDCGNNYSARGDKLRANLTTNCGCDSYDKTLKTKELEHGESQFNALYSSYQCNAKQKEIEFNINKIQFKLIVNSNCHYCGEQPHDTFKKARLRGIYIYTGIDRKNNDIGYTLENSVPCCTDCNYMKSNMPYDYFIEKIKTIYKNRIYGIH